ncbi:MAG TPA: hypothetical protein VIL20_01770 [Sandaracinaceae bacterium]
MAEGAGSWRPSDEELEVVLEVIFAVCLPDGELSEPELSRLRDRIVQLENGSLRPDRIDGLMLRAAMQLEKEPREARLAHARRVLDEKARRTALALAIEVASADGLDPRERAAAGAVADALGILPGELDAMLAA